ncbi:hypothetical protein Tco_0429704 [Tanacetum coccineum]
MLCDRFPRLYHLGRKKEGSVMDKGSWVNDDWCWEWDWVREIRGRVCKEFDDLLGALQNVVVSKYCRDKWRWALVEDGEFKVKELTRLIEEKILQVESGVGFRYAWNRRGIDLDSVLCPSCNNCVESCAHSLATCDLAISVWEKVFSWWKMGTVNAFSIGEFFSSYGNLSVPVDISRVWQAVLWSTGYFIWKERNARVFGNKVSSTNQIVQDFQLKSYEWIIRRSNKYKEIGNNGCLTQLSVGYNKWECRQFCHQINSYSVVTPPVSQYAFLHMSAFQQIFVTAGSARPQRFCFCKF